MHTHVTSSSVLLVAFFTRCLAVFFTLFILSLVQFSGQVLIDVVKVLRALLPDGHRFVSSAYLLKNFSDPFGKPAPKEHSYCGNCLGRIQKGQAQCLKEKCQKVNKKITSWSSIYTCGFVSCVEVNKLVFKYV